MALHIKSARSVGLPADLIHNLIAARQARGWSQRELGAKVGLPQVHISGIETGKVVPRFNTLLDIVRVLDYDLLLVPRTLVPMVQSIVREHGKPIDNEDDAADQPLYSVMESDDGNDA